MTVINTQKVFPAPMAGYTDFVFRRLLRRLGVKYTFTEMISAKALVLKNPRTLEMIEKVDREPHTIVQLFGSEPHVMADAARILYDKGVKKIDINMGCPQKKVVKTGAGAALMKEPLLAAKIIKEIIRAVDIDLSVKMRLGWKEKTAPDLAHICEQEGVKFITVHARTKTQMFSGNAKWDEVKKVKEKINIPLIINGDIIDIKTAQIALKESSADAVMIGRAMLGQPWLIPIVEKGLSTSVKEQKDIKPIIPLKRKLEIALMHLELMEKDYNLKNIWVAKRQLSHYSHGLRYGAHFRKEIFSAKDWKEMRELLLCLFEKNTKEYITV